MAAVGDEEELQVAFTHIDARDLPRKFVVGVFVEEDDTYAGVSFHHPNDLVIDPLETMHCTSATSDMIWLVIWSGCTIFINWSTDLLPISICGLHAHKHSQLGANINGKSIICYERTVNDYTRVVSEVRQRDPTFWDEAKSGGAAKGACLCSVCGGMSAIRA